MIKFAKDSINKKFNVKGFGDWLNASITNKAKFGLFCSFFLHSC